MKKPEELLEWGGTKKDSTLPAFSRHMMQVSKINLTISMTLTGTAGPKDRLCTLFTNFALLFWIVL